MHEEEKYYGLMALVCRKLPHYAVQMTIDAGYKGSRQMLHDVKRGRTINLTALVALIRASLIGFEIPAHLLPAEAEEPAVAA